MTFGEHDGEDGSFPHFAIDVNLSSMEFDDLLNEGETDNQALGIF